VSRATLHVSVKKTKMIRKYAVIFFSVTALLLASYGVFRAMHSPLFTTQVVEVADQPEQAPVDAQTITDLAAVPVGRVNLFDLDLQAIERRILTNSWIREVHLQKRFPQTLSISVVFRDPRGLFQGADGMLSYIDVDGKTFGRANLMFQPDLPVFSGFQKEGDPKILEALRFFSNWEKSTLGKRTQISALSWDEERGYRALVTYEFASSNGNSGARGRTWVDFGQNFDGDPNLQLKRLSYVFQYLAKNLVSARQIFADAGKKVVVKTAKGS